MSELITRRTFLKTTGAAALVAAAGSMLVGCGEGYGATPGNPTLPTIDTGTFATFGSTYVDMGPLTGTWVSRTTYESDGWRHNYLYTGLSIIFTPVFLLITPITQLLPLRFLPVILPANIMVLPNLV